MVSLMETTDPADGAAPRDDRVERPAFVSKEVWQVVELAAEHNKVLVRDYVEKALLDEAMILEQVRFGRTWMVKDERGNVGEVDFN